MILQRPDGFTVNGEFIHLTTLNKAVNEALKAIGREIPEETRVPEVYRYIFEECKRKVDEVAKVDIYKLD